MARWRLADVSDRSRQAGLAVAAPVWRPAAPGAPPTAGRIGTYLERVYHREATDDLARHLGDVHGIDIATTRELDVGVFHVGRHDGPDWIARVFPAARPLDASEGDAEIIQFLERAEYPAERCGHPEPFTVYEDQAVVVTEYIPGRPAKPSPATFSRLGDLLGQLHAVTGLPTVATRPGGG